MGKGMRKWFTGTEPREGVSEEGADRQPSANQRGAVVAILLLLKIKSDSYLFRILSTDKKPFLSP